MLTLLTPGDFRKRVRNGLTILVLTFSQAQKSEAESA